MLNEECQRARKTVEYTEKREGPKHDETWTLTVLGKPSNLLLLSVVSDLPNVVDQIQHGQGTGKTRDIAKAAAAKMALESQS